MSTFVDFLDRLPANNAAAVGEMLNLLSEEDSGFLEDYLLKGSELPTNIISRIDLAFVKAGYPQFNWDNCQIEFTNKPVHISFE